MIDARVAMKPGQQFPSAGFALLLTVCVVALQMGFALPFELAAAVYAAVTHQPPSHPAQHPLVLGLVNLAAIGVIVALGIFLAKTPMREILALRRVRGVLVLPILLSALAAWVLLSEADNVFRWIFPTPKFLTDFFSDLFSTDRGWAAPLFATVVVAPVTEEIMFRGLILRGLLSRYSVRWAVVISAALFAFAHMNPWQLISTFAIGVLFGWWFYRTRSVVPGLIGHALGNGAVLACDLLPVEISGFNKGEPYAQVEFQPLWFDLAGLVVLALGIWLFHRWSPKPEKPSLSAYDGPTPPVIPQGG